MLVISRKQEESIIIEPENGGDPIEIKIISIDNQVKVGISAPRGCKLRITRLCSGPRENCRLCALGLTPGTQVQVLSCGGGASRLLVRGCNLALDPSLASLVACELA